MRFLLAFAQLSYIVVFERPVLPHVNVRLCHCQWLACEETLRRGTPRFAIV